MTRFFHHGLAAIAALALFAGSFGAVINVPADAALAATSIAAPLSA